jgi:hypothetical protein
MSLVKKEAYIEPLLCSLYLLHMALFARTTPLPSWIFLHWSGFVGWLFTWSSALGPIGQA